MAVRVGVDVGGTFTKAVACEARTGEVLARSVVPTTHASPLGVAAGVVEALGGVFEEVRRSSLGPVLLVAHSTTQAVNALLEGDTAVVGVLGIGRPPDIRRARRRTRVGEVRVAPGRTLRAVHAFLDASAGLDRSAVERAVRALLDAGAGALAVSGAFGVEDPSAERLVLKVAADLGVPACAGHELSGLYGLEVRTVTAALNASILPTALAAASVVGEAVAREAPEVPLLVMRGDGGAADLATMRRRPLLTAFSGPAASVAGALRHLVFRDGVVIEVGGTSTNVSVVRGGRPVLSYVRVLDHVTFVRSLDVRVIGVAGGSLLRVRRRRGWPPAVEVGPRSAHIAGLPYCSFARPAELVGGQARLAAPRPGDPPEYVVVGAAGRTFALTLTCAANALGTVPPGAYAEGDREAARLGFEALGRLLRRPWEELARAALRAAARAVSAAVAEASAEHGLEDPVLVGLGGGAGALLPALGELSGRSWWIPAEAEVISSVGDALSLVRVEVERGVARPTPGLVEELVREAEEAAVVAGAAPATVQVETEAVPERRALRAVAVGSAALRAGPPGEGPLDEELLWLAAKETLGDGVSLVARTPFYGVFVDDEGRFAVVDRHASVAATGRGLVLEGPGARLAAELGGRLRDLTRHLGPIAVAPALRLVRGARLVDLTFLSAPDRLVEAAVGECRLAGQEPVVALVSPH
ncbi:MAG TPA: hydantoinase/oxoprolinase family protein [Actinomycetota bacterium]|nr:hydantoinase/oxoprolinase family protein [Actinomycetota bacterium]